MGWNYTNKKPSQMESVGLAVAALGVAMLIFGIWHFQWNNALVDPGTVHVTAARYRAMAMPAVFGLAVFAGGTAAVISARRQRRRL